MNQPEPAIFKKTVMPNGIRVLTEAIPYVRSVSLGFWLDVGSRDENDVSAGISHFIEHMVFKGTSSRSASDIASCLESVGGVLNAFTSREQTCFFSKFLDEHLEKAVDLLSDLITHPLYNASDIEKEKKVILEEISDVEDSPGDLVHDLFARTIFGKHPLGRPIMGSRTTVKGLNRAKIHRYVDKHYRPNKIVIAASGNISHDHLVDLVGRYCVINEAAEVNNGRKQPAFKPFLKAYARKSAQAHVCLGLPAKEFIHRSRPAMLLLNSVLGGGMSSRLFQHIREDLGLVYTVYSYLDFFVDTGIFGIYLGTEKKNVKKALAAVKTEIEKLANEPLSSAELTDAKEQLKGNLVLGLENTSNRMNRLAKHEFLANRYISLDETISAIDAVTPDEIHEIARELFAVNRFSGAALGPVGDDIYTALE